MHRIMAAAFAVVLCGSHAEAAALLVTMTTGTVSVKDGSGTRAAPSGGFPLLDGQTLVIAEGGSAVVLSQGNAQKILGPRSFTTRDAVVAANSGSGPSENALARVMGRKTSVSAVGATRGGGAFSLERPIEGTRLSQLKSIQWTCGDCGQQTVEVIELESFEAVWEGTGSRKIGCDGLKLQPGEYAVKLDGQYLAFTVVPESEASEAMSAVSQAMSFASDLDPVSRSAIGASIWWQAGMPTDAFYVLDKALVQEPGNADLNRLVNEYQQKLQRP